MSFPNFKARSYDVLSAITFIEEPDNSRHSHRPESTEVAGAYANRQSQRETWRRMFEYIQMYPVDPIDVGLLMAVGLFTALSLWRRSY